MFRLSPINKTATATVTASTQDATYLAANLRTPQRPTLPARTTAITDSWWVLDHAAATPVDVVALIGANFTSVKIQMNATDAWGAPTYDSGTVTISPSPGHGRYHLIHRPAIAQNLRYTRIFVPAQSTTDGAGYFRLGGVHEGVSLTPLEDVLYEYELRVVEPRLDVAPDHKGWMTRLSMGPSLLQLLLKRRTRLSLTVPGVSDDFAAWGTLEQAWALADYALVSLRDDVTSWGWIMRRLSLPRWVLSTRLGDADLELEEMMR